MQERKAFYSPALLSIRTLSASFTIINGIIIIVYLLVISSIISSLRLSNRRGHFLWTSHFQFIDFPIILNCHFRDSRIDEICAYTLIEVSKCRSYRKNMMPPYLVTCLSLLYDYITWLTNLTTEKKYLNATYNWKIIWQIQTYQTEQSVYSRITFHDKIYNL